METGYLTQPSGLMHDDLLLAKLRPDAKIPTKREGDAGRDVYACFDDDFINIPPLTSMMIPTGIASAMHPSKYIQIEERGSTGTKGIKKSSGVIDSNFRGEWIVVITNCSSDEIVISKLTEDELIKKYCTDDNNKYFTINYSIRHWVDKTKNKYLLVKRNDSEGFKLYETIFYPYDKAIAQAIVHEVPVMNVQEVDYETLQNIPSERGTGKLGSSNK